LDRIIPAATAAFKDSVVPGIGLFIFLQITFLHTSIGPLFLLTNQIGKFVNW